MLRDGPKCPRAIADSVGANELALRRLLRALTTIDVLTEDKSGQFTPTPMGELLQSDHPQSVHSWAVCMAAPFVWRPWGQLYESVMTGKPAFNQVFGDPFYEYLARRPQEAALFNAAMTKGSKDYIPTLLQAYDFSGFAKIVDVGGGQGALLRGILEQCPEAMGVLYDLPSVVVDADELRSSAVAARCELVGGNMFQSVPAGGDAYILRAVMMDWSDDEALQVLRNCRAAISNQGKLLVLNAVLKPSNEPDFAKWLDLNMLVLLTGRERTEEEFRELLEGAGFKLTQIIHTGGPVIEAVPM